jgi:hypothetical protein
VSGQASAEVPEKIRNSAEYQNIAELYTGDAVCIMQCRYVHRCIYIFYSFDKMGDGEGNKSFDLELQRNE